MFVTNHIIRQTIRRSVVLFGVIGLLLGGHATQAATVDSKTAVVMQQQPEPVPPSSDGERALGDDQHLPLERAATIGTLILVVLVVVVHRIHLRRQSQ